MGVLKWMGVLNTYSHVCPAHWPWCWYPNHFFAVNEPFCLFHGGDVTCFDVMKLLAEWDEVINSTRTKLLHLPQKVTRNSSLIFHWIFKLKRIESMRWFMILIDSMPVFKLSQCPNKKVLKFRMSRVSSLPHQSGNVGKWLPEGHEEDFCCYNYYLLLCPISINFRGMFLFWSIVLSGAGFFFHGAGFFFPGAR